MSSITSGRVSANSAVSSSSDSAVALAGALDRRRSQIAPDRALVGAPGATARDEAPVLRLHDVEHALLHPLRVHVLRVDTQALGERVALRLELLAHACGARGRRARARCGRRWPRGRPGRWRPPRRAAATRSERFGGICTPTSGISRRDSWTRATMSSRVTLGGPGRHGLLLGQGRVRGIAVTVLGGVGDLRRLAPVVVRVRHEVLEDHLLDVAVLGLNRGQGLERGDAILQALPDPHEDAAGERDLQLAGCTDGVEPHVGVLGRASPGAPRGRG